MLMGISGWQHLGGQENCAPEGRHYPSPLRVALRILWGSEGTG